MSENPCNNTEQDNSANATLLNWLDIFFGFLTKPLALLDKLSCPAGYGMSSSLFLGAFLVIIICSLVDGTIANLPSSFSGVALNILGSFLTYTFFWFVIAIFLRLLAILMKIATSLRHCIIVTGWAFAPLVFKAIAACFSNATIFGDLLSFSLAVWFLILQLFAFDSVLKLGRFKTLGIVFILPPCLFLTYFLSMLFAGMLVSESFF